MYTLTWQFEIKQEVKFKVIFDKSCIVDAKPIVRSFPEIVFVVVIHIYHKRSKISTRGQIVAKKILHRSQDQGWRQKNCAFAKIEDTRSLSIVFVDLFRHV